MAELRPGFSRAPVVTGMAVCAFDVVWFVIGLFHRWPHASVGWYPLPFSVGLAVYTCWKVTRRTELARSTRRFWGQIGFALALLGIALASNARDTFRGPGEPSQYLSPLTLSIYLAIVAVAIWALLRLPTWQRTRGDWTRFGLDAGIIALTNGALIWHFALRKADLFVSRASSLLPTVAICLAASVCMITFVKVAFAGTGEVDKRALHIVSLGVGVAASLGSLSVLIADKPWLSITFLASSTASLFCQLGAARQLRAPAAVPIKAVRGRRFSVLPYLAVAAMSATLLSISAPRGGEELVVVLCAVALTVLVLIRQISALRENSRLLDTVDANLRQLHAYQDELAHQATHDVLTEIPNRTLFTEKLTAQLGTDEPFSVALLDLDDFKTVNDRLGHGTGDALLKAVSRRLLEAMRPGDVFARLGGDEFTLLLPGRTDEQIAMLLRTLVDRVREPMVVDGQEMVARISVGVTAVQAGDTPEEMLRRADVAMYAAKTVGGSRWTWFDPIMDRLADNDAQLGTDLRHAIERDELFMLYQPIVELPHGRLAGVEALIRWRHPQLGLVSPATFIPLAERNGAIIDIGWWVLEQVVRQAAAWELAYGESGPEKVSVNISARQLSEPGFAAKVGELLASTGINPYRIVAEVTETAVLGTGEALDAVRDLHRLGMRVALDDFGTGQSSLTLLVDTPVGVLKVDKSFVDGVTASSPQAVIVDGLIGITDGLRIEAVAEGVETAEQAHRLHAVGYRFAQGFHFARPMPPEDVELLLEAQAVVTPL